MIRAGCRYLTLAGAKKHWGDHNHHRGRKICDAFLLQIAALVATARANGWTKVKFDPTVKPVKKVKVIGKKRKTKKAVKKSSRRR